MTKTDRFELRLPPDEKEAAAAEAARWGMSLSEYIRISLLLRRSSPQQVTDVAWDTFSRLGQIYNQLSQAVCKLSQLSQAANAQGEIPERLSQELQQMDKMLRELQQVVLEVRSQIDRDDDI